MAGGLATGLVILGIGLIVLLLGMGVVLFVFIKIRKRFPYIKLGDLKSKEAILMKVAQNESPESLMSLPAFIESCDLPLKIGVVTFLVGIIISVFGLFFTIGGYILDTMFEQYTVLEITTDDGKSNARELCIAECVPRFNLKDTEHEDDIEYLWANGFYLTHSASESLNFMRYITYAEQYAISSTVNAVNFYTVNNYGDSGLFSQDSLPIYFTVLSTVYVGDKYATQQGRVEGGFYVFPISINFDQQTHKNIVRYNSSIAEGQSSYAIGMLDIQYYADALGKSPEELVPILNTILDANDDLPKLTDEELATKWKEHPNMSTLMGKIFCMTYEEITEHRQDLIPVMQRQLGFVMRAYLYGADMSELPSGSIYTVDTVQEFVVKGEQDISLITYANNWFDEENSTDEGIAEMVYRLMNDNKRKGVNPMCQRCDEHFERCEGFGWYIDYQSVYSFLEFEKLRFETNIGLRPQEDLPTPPTGGGSKLGKATGDYLYGFEDSEETYHYFYQGYRKDGYADPSSYINSVTNSELVPRTNVNGTVYLDGQGTKITGKGGYFGNFGCGMYSAANCIANLLDDTSHTPVQMIMDMGGTASESGGVLQLSLGSANFWSTNLQVNLSKLQAYVQPMGITIHPQAEVTTMEQIKALFMRDDIDFVLVTNHTGAYGDWNNNWYTSDTLTPFEKVAYYKDGALSGYSKVTPSSAYRSYDIYGKRETLSNSHIRSTGHYWSVVNYDPVTDMFLVERGYSTRHHSFFWIKSEYCDLGSNGGYFAYGLSVPVSNDNSSEGLSIDGRELLKYDNGGTYIPNITGTYNGATCNYDLYLPTNMESININGKGCPVVLDLHGIDDSNGCNSVVMNHIKSQKYSPNVVVIRVRHPYGCPSKNDAIVCLMDAKEKYGVSYDGYVWGAAFSGSSHSPDNGNSAVITVRGRGYDAFCSVDGKTLVPAGVENVYFVAGVESLGGKMYNSRASNGMQSLNPIGRDKLIELIPVSQFPGVKSYNGTPVENCGVKKIAVADVCFRTWGKAPITNHANCRAWAGTRRDTADGDTYYDALTFFFDSLGVARTGDDENNNQGADIGDVIPSIDGYPNPDSTENNRTDSLLTYVTMGSRRFDGSWYSSVTNWTKNDSDYIDIGTSTTIRLYTHIPVDFPTQKTGPVYYYDANYTRTDVYNWATKTAENFGFTPNFYSSAKDYHVVNDDLHTINGNVVHFFTDENGIVWQNGANHCVAIASDGEPLVDTYWQKYNDASGNYKAGHYFNMASGNAWADFSNHTVAILVVKKDDTGQIYYIPYGWYGTKVGGGSKKYDNSGHHFPFSTGQAGLALNGGTSFGNGKTVNDPDAKFTTVYADGNGGPLYNLVYFGGNYNSLSSLDENAMNQSSWAGVYGANSGKRRHSYCGAVIVGETIAYGQKGSISMYELFASMTGNRKIPMGDGILTGVKEDIANFSPNGHIIWNAQSFEVNTPLMNALRNKYHIIGEIIWYTTEQ